MASARSSGSDTTHHSARPRRMGVRAIQEAAMATTTNIGTSHHARRAELAYRVGVRDEFIARGRVLINRDHWYHFRRAMVWTTVKTHKLEMSGFRRLISRSRR